MPRITRNDHELEQFELHADLDDLDRRSKLKLLWAVLAHQTELARGRTERLRLARTITLAAVIILVVAVAYLTGHADPVSIIKELLAGVK